MDNPDTLKIPALVPLPLPGERMRRQVALARLLLLAIDMTPAGEPLGLETALDLVREVWHCYPELVDEFLLSIPASASISFSRERHVRSAGLCREAG
jgi:hypothetical protein